MHTGQALNTMSLSWDFVFFFSSFFGWVYVFWGGKLVDTYLRTLGYNPTTLFCCSNCHPF